MKQWLETRQVVQRLAELRSDGGAAGMRAALATVVRVRGSAYRHEGAKMLVLEDGAPTGNVSGGCLEADVREVARRVIATGTSERREYCGSADEIAAWDLGVGCEGVVDVFVEPLVDLRGTNDWLALAHTSVARHRPFVIATDLATRARATITADAVVGAPNDLLVRHARALIAQGDSGIESVDGRDVFFDVLRPPPQLVVVSAGDDARALARLASDVGFRVIVVDRRPALLAPDRWPADALLVHAHPGDIAVSVPLAHESYCIVMSHNYADDREYLRALLGTSVAYIGMLGPRQRTERILGELGAHGPVDDTRVFGPVGLDIGTDGAEQVALAIVAEVLAVRSGRQPTSLRERRAPIHASASA